MNRPARIVVAIVAIALVAGIAYSAYVGYEGSRQLVAVEELRSRDCRTPDVLFGWEYEAINYDIADDAALKAANPDMTKCQSQGARAGTDVVTEDGVHIAGWYVPAANGVGPTGPTVVLMHGFSSNKTDILGYAHGLHEEFNVVAIDQRNAGRSTGDATTAGVLEQNDLRAIIDWLEREKKPEHIGVLGNSLGAAGAITEARTDPRVEALALDSMHTRIAYQLEQRLSHAGHPSYPGTWAILAAAWLRTGLDLRDADAANALDDLRGMPMLLTHGTADDEDLPYRTEAFAADAAAAGIAVELHWCDGAGHGHVEDVCPNRFAHWTHDFFNEHLRD